MARIQVSTQQDLTLIANSASSGDELILGEGIYYLSGQIKLKRGVSITGAGSNKTLLTTRNSQLLTGSGSSTNWDKYLIAKYRITFGQDIQNADNKLKGFLIKSVTETPIHGGIGFLNQRNIEIEDVKIEDTYWSGLNLLFVDNVKVSKSSIKDCGAYVGTGQFSYAYGVVNICTAYNLDFFDNDVIDDRNREDNTYVFTSLGSTENQWQNVRFINNYFYTKSLESKWSQNGVFAPTYWETYTTALFGCQFINNYFGVTLSMIYEGDYSLGDFEYAAKFEKNYFYSNSFLLELTNPNKFIVKDSIWEAREEGDFGAIFANFNYSKRNDLTVQNLWTNTKGKKWSSAPIPQGYYYSNINPQEPIEISNVNIDLSEERLSELASQLSIGLLDDGTGVIPDPQPDPEPEPDPQPEPNPMPKITFYLYSAETHQQIKELSTEELNEVYLGDTGELLSIVAEPDFNVQYVEFFVDGNRQRRESLKPYTIAGDNVGRGTYSPWKRVEAGALFSISAVTDNGFQESMRVRFLAGSEPVTDPDPDPTPTPDTEKPSVPQGLIAISLTRSSFTLQWSEATDNEAVTGYRVFVDGAEAYIGPQTSFTVSNKPCGTNFNVEVSAFDAAGNESDKSNPIGVATLPCPPVPDTEKPSTPTGLNASNITQTSFKLDWSPSTDNESVSHYYVLINSQKYRDNIKGTSLDILDRVCGEDYLVKVVAVDSSGNESDPSIGLAVLTKDCPPDPNPNPVYPIEETLDKDAEIVLRFKEPSILGEIDFVGKGELEILNPDGSRRYLIKFE